MARSAVGPSPNTRSSVVHQGASQPPERVVRPPGCARDTLRDERMGDLEQQRCRPGAQQHRLPVDAPHPAAGPVEAEHRVAAAAGSRRPGSTHAGSGSGSSVERHVPVRLEQLEPALLLAPERLLVGVQPLLDGLLAVGRHRGPVAIGDGHHHVPVRAAVAVVARHVQPDVGEATAWPAAPGAPASGCAGTGPATRRGGPIGPCSSRRRSGWWRWAAFMRPWCRESAAAASETGDGRPPRTHGDWRRPDDRATTIHWPRRRSPARCCIGLLAPAVAGAFGGASDPAHGAGGHGESGPATSPPAAAAWSSAGRRTPPVAASAVYMRRSTRRWRDLPARRSGSTPRSPVTSRWTPAPAGPGRRPRCPRHPGEWLVALDKLALVDGSVYETSALTLSGLSRKPDVACVGAAAWSWSGSRRSAVSGASSCTRGVS